MENADQTSLLPKDAGALELQSDASSAGCPAQSTVAYIIGHITVKDPERWAEYCSKVPATVAPWGASLVFRGEGAQVLDGTHAYTDTVVIRFPNRSAINNWHESAAYQALVPIRKQAADVVIISYDGQQ
ncbi:MAG TPA: DUF1330 domain-containing protein [Eoetvoesiella sp.]